jgi:outer membrane receptor protein involved in Fe transport
MSSLKTRRTLCISFLIVLVVINVTTATQAQTTISVNGTIVDQNKAVLPNAAVQVLNLASGVVSRTTTNSSGRYTLTGLQRGTHRIQVSSTGFAEASRSITWREPGTYTEDFTLVPGVIESSITVTATKGAARASADTPQNVTVADQTQIEERRPAATLRVLERAPNLTPVTANSALERPRLRGLGSNRVLIILDGDRLNNMRTDPTTGVSPSIVDVNQLASAEVVSGAGSSLYGSDAMAGVINLITTGSEHSDDDSRLSLTFSGDVHSNNRFRRGAASLNWSKSKFALLVGGSLFRQGNYHSGETAVPLAEVVRLGTLATDMGNAIGNSVARTYAVWSLPAGAEIPNGQAHGFNDQVDLRFFPNDKHSIRYRQLNSQHENLGFSFIAPPFDQRTQFNAFRRLDKYRLRYEGRDLTPWLPRIAAGFYRQKFSYPDGTITSPITIGSSWTFVPNPAAPQSPLAVLTGNQSSFTNANFSDNKNSITTYAFDVQATFAPFAGTLFTTGVGYLRDSSADEFSRADLVAPFKVVTARASNPDSVYRNWGWFNLLETEPARWLRLTGGLRVDNWATQARVTPGFPAGVESTLLNRSFAGLVANAGPINTAGAAGIIDLINGVGGISTSRTVVTGNAGVTLRLPQSINPYFRWGNSYREPGITERYLLRDFGDPTFSVLVIPNTTLKPERGNEFDAGVKILRPRWNVTLAYFVNNLHDFVGSAFAPPLFVPADPANGINPISPFFPFHGVLYVQRTNTARARIKGLEATYEISLPLGHTGTITPFGTLGWLKGSNLTPDQNTLSLISQFYNRSDTAVPLHGSATDAPLTSITPFRTIDGVRFDTTSRRWFGEYEVRYQSRITRVDPGDLTAAISTQYGSVASLNSFAVQTLRAGYSYRKEAYRLSFNAGVENLVDSLYFEHFQTAPAPGRSVVFGVTFEFFNLFKR